MPDSVPTDIFINNATYKLFAYKSYIYIYIYTNLLPTSIYGDKEKEKKTPEFKDKNISRITTRGKKKKVIGRKKKKKRKRPTLSHKLKEIKRYAISWSKEQKPTAKCCNATITKSAPYEVEQNYKN